VGFPLSLPIGDLSAVWNRKSQRSVLWYVVCSSQSDNLLGISRIPSWLLMVMANSELSCWLPCRIYWKTGNRLPHFSGGWPGWQVMLTNGIQCGDKYYAKLINEMVNLMKLPISRLGLSIDWN
jgi:hypothetical protein